MSSEVCHDECKLFGMEETDEKGKKINISAQYIIA